MKRSFTLLVWQTLPESVEMYLIPSDDLTDHAFAMLKLAHNTLINCEDENEGTVFVNEELLPQMQGKKILPHETQLDATITDIFVSGFIL